ncbi:hypothetical protein M413DRAFT_21000 [Hebeloma cylindrosporum]|uniref:Uncharacterized protein n=1 Tax=Hebeloma cylindrosporum TaxID=76867 RepID=A0A0C2Z656_HEBCY|nr:hypothetical protein M413DRAFT_21000 [Hebeloma cylindrosporum h7]
MASAAQSTETERLNEIFNGLKNSNADIRLRSAEDLQRFASTIAILLLPQFMICMQVSESMPEMSYDTASKLWDDNINRRLFELTHSQNVVEAFGGLLAIEKLIDIEREENLEPKRNLFRFYNYAKHLLPNPDIDLMLAASTTLGQITKIGGPAFGERFLDFEVPAAVDLMQPEKPDSPRYAGTLILKEFARNNPYFYSHIGMVFDNILAPLSDQSVLVREGAAELLAACLEIVTQRERQAWTLYLSKILQGAQNGLKQAQPEVVHGSLLIYRELLLHAGTFMKENSVDTADQILRFKTHADPLVRETVETIIPSLAGYDGHPPLANSSAA